ncbi:MAG: hypothetical protein M1822_008252 [Bathelium mastoideum]|nr:MAG: hypothetical protein M1822_008252 [Bathelium mastoideum]
MLVIPSSVLNSIDPAWSTCSLDIRGLNDPPYALHGFASPAAPTPSSVHWGSATILPAPASNPDIGQPSKTANLPRPFGTNLQPSPESSHGISSQSDPPLGKPPGEPSKQPSYDSHSADPTNNPSHGDPSRGDPSHDTLSHDNPSSGGHVSGDPSTNNHPSGDPSFGNPLSDPSSSINPSSSQDGSGRPSGEHSGSNGAPAEFDSGGSPASENSHSSASSGQGTASGFVKSGSKDGSSGGPPAEHNSDQDSSGEIVAGEVPSLLDPAGNRGAVKEIASMIHDPNNVHRVDPPRKSDSSQVEGDSTPNGPDRAKFEGNDPVGNPNSEANGPNTHDHDPHDATGPAHCVDQVPDDIPSIGRAPVIADPSRSGGIVVGTHRVAQGQTTEIDGTPISVGVNDIAVSTSSLYYLPSFQDTPALAAPIATLGRNLVYADSSISGAMVVGGTQTLHVGQSAELDGTSISVGREGVVIDGSSTIPVPTPVGDGSLTTPIATLGSVRVQPDPFHPNAIVIGGTQTLSSGQATVVDGTSVSVGPQGVVIRGSTTLPLPHVGTSAGPLGYAAIKIGSKILTAYQQSGQHAIVFGSSTLSVDGPALTTAGEVISVASSDIVVVSSGSTSTYMFSTAAKSGVLTNSAVEVEAAFTLGGEKLTAYEVAGQSGKAVLFRADGKPVTLVAGGSAATIDGQRVSLDSDGVVVGTNSREVSWSTATGVNLLPEITSLVPGSELGPWSTRNVNTGASGIGNVGGSGSASMTSTKSAAAGANYGKLRVFDMATRIPVITAMTVIG